MTAARLLLDTNILSHMMRDPHGVAASQLKAAIDRDADVQVCTSVIVDCEIAFGLARKPSTARALAYADLQQIVEVLPLDEAVAPHYARIREHLERGGTPIGPNDLLIAAHAAALDAILVTDNEREFRRVPGLQVENWLRDATALSRTPSSE